MSFFNFCIFANIYFSKGFFAIKGIFNNNKNSVMLTCDLKTQVKKLKIKLKNNFCIEKIKFKFFNILNAQFSKKKVSMFGF